MIKLTILLMLMLPLMTTAQEKVSASYIDSNATVSAFAPGIVSTRYDEGAASFSPDNNTVYFTMGNIYNTLCFSKKVNGKWQKPAVLSFSGTWNDMDPFISPDGKRMFFVSDRPIPGADPDVANKYFDIWYADHTGNDNWSMPYHADSSINTGRENNFAPSADLEGNLYWCSRDRNGNKGMQGYRSRHSGKIYGAATLMIVPGVSQVQDPFIAANGQYLVFISNRNMYVSVLENNSWKPAVAIGAPVSTGDFINAPYVSADGKTLYFASGRKAGFYKRSREKRLDYEALLKENDEIFNGNGNILMLPAHFPAGR